MTSWVDGVGVYAPGYPTVTTNIKNVTVRNLSINGNRDGYTNGPTDTYGNGVNVNGVDNFTIENVEVYDQANQGTVSTYWGPVSDAANPVYYQKSGIIRNNVVRNTKLGVNAIGAEGYSMNVIIDGNSVIGGGSIFGGIGAVGSVISPANIIISNNKLIRGAYGNEVGITLVGLVNIFIVSGNIIDQYDIGIRYNTDDATGTYHVQGLHISSNIVTNYKSFGVVIYTLASDNTSPQIDIVGNTLSATSSPNTTYPNAGIYANYTNVANNSVRTADTAAAIEADHGSNISGNIIINGTSTAGIQLTAGNTVQNYVSNNILSSFIYDQGTNIIFGNLGGTGVTPNTNKFTLGLMTFYFSNTVPVAGTYKLGDRIINNNPAVGQAKGWVCTVAGTPGTWVSEGNL